MKILLLEDDRNLANNIKKTFQKDGFAIDVFYLLKEAEFQIEEFHSEYDCIVLDINLPDGNGFKLCESIRKNKISVPVIMMTARDTVEEKIKGLNIGADDYITKPFSIAELIARVRATIRRNSKEPLPTLEIGNLKINPQTQRVFKKDKEIELSAREFAVLELLARHSDEVVTRTMIMEHVWGSDFESFSNVIDVYIKNLRKKIDHGYKKKLIHTIRGSGYSLSNKR